MVTPVVRLHTLEERIIYYALCLTWVWYVIGATYILAPALAWSLLLLILWRWLICPPDDPACPRAVPPLVWVWIVFMFVMQVALVVGHMNFDLGIPQLVKSSIGWMKGWALFAIFPLIGACLHIRAEVLYRAVGWVALQTLILVPLFVIAPLIGLPGTLYISPLQVVGGPGPEFFEVQLYGTDPFGGVRWRFFTPWAPAAAVAYGMLLVMLLRDKSAAIRVAGILATLAVAIMCKSRLGFVAIPIALIAAYGLASIHNPRVLFGCAAGALFLGVFGDQIIDLILTQKERMDQMRADSTYVRRVLGNIALHRWETEAPIWGHGIVELGPHLVEFMPIGSHHSWYGLLFVKGLVGFMALLLPLLITLGELILRSQTSACARTALAFMLLFGFFTVTENVEILAYLMWPGFILLGIVSAELIRSPFGPPVEQAAPRDPSYRSPPDESPGQTVIFPLSSN
jgi:hypothetical protein